MHQPVPEGAPVVVIGAGVAGLATATLLARAGYQVHCLERLAQPGGRAGSSTQGQWRFDTGPSWYLMPEVFEHYFQLLGTTVAEHLDLVRLTPAYSLFQVRRAQPASQDLPRFTDVQDIDAVQVPADFAALEALFESRESGAGARLRAYLDGAQQAYDLATRYFLYTTFQSFRPWITGEILRHTRLLMQLLTQRLDSYVQRSFSDPLLQKILQYPAVFLSAPPAEIPALYHILSHTDLVQGVFYPQGGFSHFVEVLEQLAREAGVQLHYETEVVQIVTANHRVRGVQTRQEFYPAAAVVSCADRQHTQQWLLGGSPRTTAYWEQRKPGISAIVVLLGIQGKLPQLTHHNLILSEQWDADFSQVWQHTGTQASASTYVCKTSATDPTAAPDDGENIFIYIPTASNPELGQGSLYGQESAQVAAIANAAIAQLGAVVGEDLSARIQVQETIGPADFAQRYHAWQGSALGLAHTLDQSAWMRGKQYDPRITGLYYAGATSTPGVGLPMCLISAENVLKLFRSDTTVQRLPDDSLAPAPHRRAPR